MNSTPYRQITKLTKNQNCILEKQPTDINSLMFYFDSCNSSVPDGMIINSNGTMVADYHDAKIIQIVDDIGLDNKVTKKGVLCKYYLSDYVKKNCKRFCVVGFKDLIGKYVVDWSNSGYIQGEIKRNNSQYIECNYYIEYIED